jgi:hypothetical protein
MSLKFVGVALAFSLTVASASSAELNATLKVIGGGRISISGCGEAKEQILTLNPQSQTAQIPAGKRVRLTAYVAGRRGHDLLESCTSNLSFVPKPVVTYVLNHGKWGENSCLAELVREDAEVSTGVALEESLKGGRC